jgi:hypothetical protein
MGKLAKAAPERYPERVCVACGEVESIHILPQLLKARRDAEARGEGLVVAVQGIALRGANCWECKGECLGHPWHHFIFRVNEVRMLEGITEDTVIK